MMMLARRARSAGPLAFRFLRFAGHTPAGVGVAAHHGRWALLRYHHVSAAKQLTADVSFHYSGDFAARMAGATTRALRPVARRMRTADGAWPLIFIFLTGGGALKEGSYFLTGTAILELSMLALRVARWHARFRPAVRLLV